MKHQWRRAGKPEAIPAEDFLRSREQYCVTACAKFLQTPSPDQEWYFTTCGGVPRARPKGPVRAMILRSGGILFPVFGGVRDIPPPRFMAGPLALLGRGRAPLHAVQGLLEDAALLAAALAGLGYPAAEHRDYDLMALDKPPSGAPPGTPPAERPGGFPRGLILRTPGFTDLEAMLPLQAAYEKEEVLPNDAVFNPALCRLNLSSILAREQTLIACLENRIVGKINTNAVSFSRIQIGGVYVIPEYRGLGIGRRMTAAFVDALMKQGRGLTLFVKKNNPAARTIYSRAGFSIIADYRISYY